MAPSFPYLIAAVAGVLLLIGLWTPLAGITIAAVEVWISLAWSGNSLIAIVLAVLGATVAMIGPGLWSIDARLYGRKHLQDPRH
jgi:putative oxidoreductase